MTLRVFLEMTICGKQAEGKDMLGMGGACSDLRAWIENWKKEYTSVCSYALKRHE